MGLTILALLLIILFFYWYFNNDRLDWRMSLNSESKEPYGTLIVKNFLKEYYGPSNFSLLEEKISDSLIPDTTGNSNFVFIGEAMLLDTADVNTLLDFVATGNTAFISSVTIPDLLMDEVYFNPFCDTLYWEDYFSYYDTALVINFTHPNLKEQEDFVFHYIQDFKIEDYYWQSFAPHTLCRSRNHPSIISQGTDTNVYMAKYLYGQGAFFLQSTPITFTNYYLTKEAGKRYTSKAFSHLKDGIVYWDNFSNVPAAIARNKNWANHNPLMPREGPLDYILSQPPLAWAWYLLLLLAMLYLLFRAKRRQRIIPVLERNRNTSLAFISTIGRLYYAKQNHRKIALQKMDSLQFFIRSKYRLNTIEKTTDFVDKLSAISEIEQSVIKKIFLIYTNIRSSTFVSDKTLIELHKLIHHFYKNCK